MVSTSRKVWVKKQCKTKLGGESRCNEKGTTESENELVISYVVDEDTLQIYAQAMVGEVIWLGKSYTIQDKFISQGVFSIKATTMGANLVLLEGVRGEEDFMGFVEEAKEWLLQWFRWIRPWKSKDVDHERVAWIRCFGIPMHVWNGDFFTKISEHLGTYLYADDNTKKRRSLDVARILIRTTLTDCLNQKVEVSINNERFSIKIMEDWSAVVQSLLRMSEVVTTNSGFSKARLRQDGCGVQRRNWVWRVQVQRRFSLIKLKMGRQGTITQGRMC